MPSTVIRRYDYDPEMRELTITFVSGRKYSYFAVPPEKFSAFTHAASRGTFFNREIRDAYNYREITSKREHAE